MWAGSQLEFGTPIRIGDSTTRVSTIADVSEKRGRTGTLVFVKLRHDTASPVRKTAAREAMQAHGAAVKLDGRMIDAPRGPASPAHARACK